MVYLPTFSLKIHGTCKGKYAIDPIRNWPWKEFNSDSAVGHTSGPKEGPLFESAKLKLFIVSTKHTCHTQKLKGWR